MVELDNFGFIISRHVNSEKTNMYWNQAVKCIRKKYPLKKIVIIDDNSNWEFVKPEYPYRNLEIIKSEYPRRGELLPYYYFHKYHWFHHAVIIHDSVFFHKRIPFETLQGFSVIPLWYFNPDKENFHNTLRIASSLSNNHDILQDIIGPEINILGMSKAKWRGCFGVQSFIKYEFLAYLQQKYNLFNMLNHVGCRDDRCSLERIMGIIFCRECPKLKKNKSVFGLIFNYIPWGYTFDAYLRDGENNKLLRPVIKVWTGR